MQSRITDDIKIINTTKEDLPLIHWLFEQTMKMQGENGYKVWGTIDKVGLETDIKNNLQYKILKDDNILCIFTIQHNDPLIWRDRDKNNAIYLHRIVANPNFRGRRLFEKVLIWAKQFALQHKLKFIRMDTWADNKKLIDYYKSFGFSLIEIYKTNNSPKLPIQNQNLTVALLELKLIKK